MKKNLLLSFFFFTIILVTGQQSDPLDGPKENVHLHLNKTTFLQGERLWFKAYVMDQNTKLPAMETTNLHVGIYAGDGEEVKRKLLYVENGMAQGDFGIDSTLVDTQYTVLAWTNYMRNFKELEPFRQRIRIVRDGTEEETREVNMKISVYPEGGQLIAGTYNNLGILVDNGLGQGVKVNNLELVDEVGTVLRKKIATNKFGMGKVGFDVKAETSYYLQRKGADGELIRQRLPLSVNKQFGIYIDNREDDKVLIGMMGSEALFKAKDGEMFSLAVYQDEFIGFENFEVNMDKPVLWFDRNQMPRGIVTAVLFDTDLRPVSHRMFFNHREDMSKGTVEIDHCLTAWGDSLQIDLTFPEDVGQIANLSVSVLPMDSGASRPDHSILSSFMVKPYVEMHLGDGYFFEVDDRQRRYELDKRLLIEGWGKYNWDSRKWEEVKLEFELENGIPFSGSVADADLRNEYELALFIGLSKTLDYIDLKSDASFEFSAPLFEADSISFSLIGAGGSLRKPIMEWQVDMPFVEESAIRPWLNGSIRETQMNFDDEIPLDGPLDLDKQTIDLDEVTVFEKRFKSKIIDFSPTTLGRAIGDEEIERHKSLVNFLAGLGFGIGSNGGTFNLYKGVTVVPLYVEGLLVEANEILGIALKNVKLVTYSKTFVSVVLNQNYVSPERRNQFIKFAIEKGYAQPQNYFAPNYPDYSDRIFITYGALD
ncbi:MAG: hypothetical protein AAGH81_03365, partial [Bacteroidota bacterium]